MRMLLILTALITSACSVIVPGGDDPQAEEIKSDEAIRLMLPEAVPDDYSLFAYGPLYDIDDDDGDNPGELLGMDSQFANPHNGSIVSLCVSTEDGPDTGDLGCSEDHVESIERDGISLTIAASCSSEECDSASLGEWLALFGTDTPTPDQATNLLVDS